MAKIISNSKIIVNWWDFYLVKWGIKKNTTLLLKSKPDILSIVLDKSMILGRMTLIKTVFRLLNEDRIEYYDDSKEMVIYGKNKEINRRGHLDIKAIENIERLLNLRLPFEEYGADFFVLDIDKGFKFIIRKDNIYDLGVANETFFKGEYSSLSAYLKGSTVLDIGSYIGDSAIKFILEGAKKVYSYEPHPGLFKIALKNMELNNLNNKIILKNYGVGDKDEVVDIYEDNLGATSCFGLENKKGGRKVKLKITPLQQMIEEIGDIDVMKMDCEGAEFKAILSCPIEYLRKINVMVIEYHDDPLVLIEHLKRNGFKARIIHQCVLANKNTGLLFATRRDRTN